MTSTAIGLPQSGLMNSNRIYHEVMSSQYQPNLRATHDVRMFLLAGEPCIWKGPAFFAGPINLYYAIQESGFLNSRNFLVSGRAQILAEAKKLDHLGSNAPGTALSLRHYDPKRGALVRSYVRGPTFRDMDFEEQTEAIPSIVDLVNQIHRTGVAIGDAHVKNVILDGFVGKYKWLDFDGRFDACPVRAKANDLLKLVYSAFTETRDIKLAVRMAEELRNYGSPKGPDDKDVKRVALKTIADIDPSIGTYFTIRAKEETFEEIKDALFEALVDSIF